MTNAVPRTRVDERKEAWGKTLLYVCIALVLYHAVSWFAEGGLLRSIIPAFPLVERAYLLFLFVCALLVWLRSHYDSLAPFGLQLSLKKRWIVPLSLLLVAVDILISSVSMPMLESAFGPRDLERFDILEDNTLAYILLLPCIWLFAAFGEEVFYRGFVMTRIERLLGGTKLAILGAVILQAIIFGAGHLYQGISGAILAGFTAVSYGAFFYFSKRCLWVPVFAHGLLDTLGLTLIYLGAMP